MSDQLSSQLRACALGDRRMGRRGALRALAAALAAGTLARRALAQTPETPDALTPVRERYAALQSYADTGSVLTETQWPGSPVIEERGSFTTLFKAPRMFFFDFVEDEAAGSSRYVIWCDGGDFQSWWSDTGVHEVHSGGRGAIAFLNGAQPSMGTTLVIPPLLFQQAELGGSVLGLTDISEAGEEDVDGRHFRKIAAETIVAGKVVRPHPTTLWIDPETLLIHKILEDTPPESDLYRGTTTIEPEADLEIDESRFQFTPPS